MSQFQRSLPETDLTEGHTLKIESLDCTRTWELCGDEVLLLKKKQKVKWLRKDYKDDKGSHNRTAGGHVQCVSAEG